MDGGGSPQVGRKTVYVVLKYYFKPGREYLRAVLGDKLPDVLTAAKTSRSGWQLAR